MGNLLFAGMYRLLRSKVFYVGILAMIFLEVWVISNSRQGSYFVEGLESQNLFSFNMFVPLGLAVFCGLFIGEEHTSNALRNQLIVGHSKAKVYLANLLLSALAGLSYFAVSAVSGLLFGLATGSELQFEALELGCYFFLSLCAVLGAASLSALLANLFTSRSMGVVVSLLLAIGLLFFAGNLSNTMSEPETIPQYRPIEQLIGDTTTLVYAADPTLPEVPNPAYPQGAWRVILEFLWNFLPACQGTRLTEVSITAEAFFPLLGYAALFIVLTTAASLAIFQRKDVK